ncbi:DUF883 family protein [Chitinimonas sp. BJB300]|uniref:DUF883 family protein n=1 Tax=Chitinimonas sp. BJB300 TaxID=1559339 RepID=UPI000C0DB5D4|nr:DUF883 family protein [Chitinimonas sp. BJB300]PHV09633.1 hypothetical protein CSQ89_20625 [Chitinimonas sp. BJB300]TSJ90154.1 DUF883 domain-containing protein [Chitinimonas sp. BJB300]
MEANPSISGGAKQPTNPQTNNGSKPAGNPSSGATRWQEAAAKGRSKREGSATQEQFQKDLSAFVSDVESLLSRGGSLSAEALQVSKEQLSEKMLGIKEQLSEFSEKYSETTSHAVDIAQDYVRSRPLQSVGIAFGVGAVVGLLVGKNR